MVDTNKSQHAMPDLEAYSLTHHEDQEQPAKYTMMTMKDSQISLCCSRNVFSQKELYLKSYCPSQPKTKFKY